MWFAGIDWANDHHDLHIIDEAGRRMGALRVAHNPEGLDRLNGFLEQIAGTKKELMACIIETSSGLLIAYLVEHDWPVYPVNPKTVDRHRSASGAKTDQIDAYLLAKHGRSEFVDLHRLQPDSGIVQELKLLTRDQDALIQMQTRLVNQLTACLKAYYPVALDLFGKLHQKSALLFLQAYPTQEMALAASAEQITAVLKQAGHTRTRQLVPQMIEQLHQPSLVAHPVTTRAKSRLMMALVTQLLPLVEQISLYDEEITRLFLMHEDNEVFSSLPRAGKRLAPRLLAELGDNRERYEKTESLQALAGTAPVLFQSGTYKKTRRRYACIKPLRKAMHSFAWQSTQQESWAKAYYERKRAEGQSHTVAVRALSNIWCRILFALWQKRESYQSSTFETAQRLHGRRTT